MRHSRCKRADVVNNDAHVASRVRSRIIPDVVGVGLISGQLQRPLEVFGTIEVDHRTIEPYELESDAAEIRYEQVGGNEQRIDLVISDVPEPQVRLEPTQPLLPVHSTGVELIAPARRWSVA